MGQGRRAGWARTGGFLLVGGDWPDVLVSILGVPICALAAFAVYGAAGCVVHGRIATCIPKSRILSGDVPVVPVNPSEA